MKTFLKTASIIAVIVLLFFGGYLLLKPNKEKIEAANYLVTEVAESEEFGSGSAFESIYYNAIGTPTAASTLTQVFENTSSTVVMAKGLNNIVIAGEYTPTSEDSLLYIEVERSLDSGTTFLPYSVLQPFPTQTLVYSNGAATTGTEAIPFTIPGGETSVSGTAIGFSFDLTMAADYLRVSLKESTTSTAGSAFIQLLLNSN